MRIGPWVAFGAALWAAVFAVFHIMWAAGWYLFLDADEARIAFATLWKWTFDVAVAIICLIAVPVALAPVMPWGQRAPRRLVYALALIGSGLLLVRSVASLVQTGYLIAAGRFQLEAFGIWEPWFYLGATLFMLSTWRVKRVGWASEITASSASRASSRRP